MRREAETTAPGAAGVEVWRVQALARRSSPAILTYLENTHAQAPSDIAAEATLQRDVNQLRGDLAGARAQ
eukprot:13660728-Alexandrium_andersonii.AAC.1